MQHTLTRRPKAWRRGLLTAAAISGSLGMGAVALETTSAYATTPTCSSSTGATGSAGCTITGTATITGGTLSIEAPSAINWAATLNGLDQSVDGYTSSPGTSPVLTVDDATGTDNGWNVNLDYTTFTNTTTSSEVISPDTGSTSNLFLNDSSSSASGTTAITATPNDPSDSPISDATTTYPVSILDATGVTSPTPSVIYSADAGSVSSPDGMGSYNLASDWWLNIPASTYAGSYASTMTIAVTSGP